MNTVTDQKKINYINIALLVTFLLMTVVQLIVSYVPGASKLVDNYVVNILLSQGLTILPIIIIFRYLGLRVTKEIRLKKMKVSNIALSILLAFLLRPVLNFVNAVSLCFTNNETGEMILDISEQIPFPVAVLLVAVLPAIIEETLFRGVVYQNYKKAGVGKAVILSALVFGLFHGNLNQFTYAFVMGMIMIYLIEASGSIVSSMIVHFITNVIPVCAIYALPALYEVLKSSVKIYEELGMTSMIEMIEYNIGDLSLTGQEWMRQMMEESEKIDVNIGVVIMNYLPSAVIFGTLAWLVIKAIARNSGNWDRFRVIFLGEDSVPVEKESKGPYTSESTTDLDEMEGDSSLILLTIPLMVTLALGVVMIFVYETLKMLPVLS
ncbi:MAG: CPBP family intramembrane metalloprotease [Lachnospiraceae bacterium]|nr:CPBP family intramembrane metalloprotease [Lachnospiraceae bacterium]